MLAAFPMLLAAQKPHVVFFMADDTGWSNVGWHNEQMKTPHADALVKEGVELDRHYAFLYAQVVSQSPGPSARANQEIDRSHLAAGTAARAAHPS